MKERLIVIRGYLLTGTIFYLIFWHFLYFLSTLVVLGLYTWYCVRSVMKVFDSPKFAKILIDNQMNIQKIARITYRWNPLARIILIKIMEKYAREQESSNEFNKSNHSANIIIKKYYLPCLVKFKITEDFFNNINEHDLKNIWKHLVRENHPDKFQEDIIKLEKTQETAELNNCKDILLKVINTRK